MIDVQATDALNAWLDEHMRALDYRYFQRRRGPMFCWTVERFEGHYASMVMAPVGKGSRSGKAEEWQLEEESLSAHQLRKDAKARALRLFREWEAS